MAGPLLFLLRFPWVGFPGRLAAWTNAGSRVPQSPGQCLTGMKNAARLRCWDRPPANTALTDSSGKVSCHTGCPLLCGASSATASWNFSDGLQTFLLLAFQHSWLMPRFLLTPGIMGQSPLTTSALFPDSAFLRWHQNSTSTQAHFLFRSDAQTQT